MGVRRAMSRFAGGLFARARFAGGRFARAWFALAPLASALIAVPFVAWGQQPGDASTLPPVVVTGSLVERSIVDAPYAIDVVGADALRNAGPMVNLSEALSRVPGLTINNRSNYAQDLQISSRGFGARSTFGVRGLRLYTDGIPATMPDGQGQVTHFDLAGAERIEVLRGPFSVLYGNSSGGVIALFTAEPTQRRVELGLDYGTYGLRQERVSVEAPIGTAWSLKADASHFGFENFRPQGAAKRDLGNFRLGWHGENDRVVLLGGTIEQNAEDPLGLTRALLTANPRQTTPEAVQYQTRKTARQTQGGVRWQHGFTDSVLSESAVTAYAGTRSVMQWQAIPPATEANPRSPGGVVDYDRNYEGVEARLTWRWTNVDVTAGAAVEREYDHRRGEENFVGTGAAQVLGVTGRLRRNETNTVETRDAYAQSEVRVTPTFSATAGVRSGEVRFGVRDRYLSNGDDSGDLRFGYTNPVVGLVWKPQTPLSIHIGAGKGFESPTLNELAYRPDGGAGINTNLHPATSTQVEAGARWFQSGITGDVTVFDATTENEIGVQTNTSGRATYQNVGRTERAGVEASLGWQVATGLHLQLALTGLHATYTDGFLTCTGTPCTRPTVVVAAGNRIAGTSGKSAYGELAWTPWPSMPTTVAVEVRAQGSTAVNDVNSDFAGGSTEAALRLSHAWLFNGPTGQRIELLGRIDNLTDRRYAGSVIVNDTNGRYFEPGQPRSGLIGVRLSSGF